MFKSISRRSVLTRLTQGAPDVDIARELSFKQFRLMPELTSVLSNSLGIETPSPVQALAIPHLIRGSSALVGGQTGTGKTLAYTLPLMHRLK